MRKKLDNRGFAISAILYTMLILIVLLMFLIISIISNRRATLNKLTENVRDKIGGEVVGKPAEPVPLYDKIKVSAVDDSSINFKQASSDTNGKGTYVMHSTTSTTHPIYYYRGDIHNNFVLFAGFCWQIVRTTDTGGIKLIYVSSGNTCQYNKNSVISTTKTKYSGSLSTYLYTSSTVKTTIENWYNNNIKNKTEASKVESSQWCNDTIASSTARTPNVNSCSRKVTATIGLPTYDEMILAGGVYAESGVQRNYWLYVPQNYKVGSGFSSGTALDNITTVGMTIDTAGSRSTVYYVGSNGQIHSYTVTTAYNIRPMIVLKHDVIWASGTGTSTDPYQIQP